VVLETEYLPRREARQEDKFGAEALRRDIEENVRRFGGWEEITKARTLTEREQRVVAYLNNVEEARQQMYEIAQNEGCGEETLLLIQAAYRAEEVRVWTLFPPRENERAFSGILSAVEWQHDVTNFILALQRRYGPSEKTESQARRFWSAYNALFNSLPPSKESERLQQLAEQYRRGIIRPLGLGYILERRNGWKVQTPPAPEDDALLKVDLVASLPDKRTLLLQLKAPQDAGTLFDAKIVNPAAPSPSNPELREFQRGIRKYLKKYNLDPARVQGVFAQLSTTKFSPYTGIPEDARFAARVQNFFRDIAGRR
jgi:hypothetical protein